MDAMRKHMESQNTAHDSRHALMTSARANVGQRSSDGHILLNSVVFGTSLIVIVLNFMLAIFRLMTFRKLFSFCLELVAVFMSDAWVWTRRTTRRSLAYF